MHVAVLGYDLAQALFPDGNAVGRTFMLDGAEFTVIGVQAKAKGGFFGENSADTQITIPLRHGESRYPEVERYMITAKAKPGMRKDAYEEVEDILRKARRLPTRNAGRFFHLHARPDYPAVRSDHRADRPDRDRHFRRWAFWWAASA